MSKYLTNLKFANIIASVAEDCGVIDTDVISISAGSHDVSVHLYNTPTSTAFLSEAIKQFGLTLTQVKNHGDHVTTCFEAKTHMGPVRVDVTLSAR